MSDEVSQFLEQVERLRGQQIEEDDVRARELEDYLAAKRERQARREGEQRNKRKKEFSHPLPLLHFSFPPRGFPRCIDGAPFPFAGATYSVVHPVFISGAFNVIIYLLPHGYVLAMRCH
jgi:hypothetical protein